MKLLVLALALIAFGAQDKPPRALDLLDESGHQFEKAGNGFAVKFNGNNLKDIRIIVVQAGEVIVLGNVLIPGTDVADVAGLQAALLRANDDYDYVKTTLDDDGDYSIRMDLLAAGLTGRRLADQLVQIATATDLLQPVVDKYRKKLIKN
jgi:hypothetical protein